MTNKNQSVDRRGPYVGFVDPTEPPRCSPLAPPPPPKPGSFGDLLKTAIDSANKRNKRCEDNG